MQEKRKSEAHLGSRGSLPEPPHNALQGSPFPDLLSGLLWLLFEGWESCLEELVCCLGSRKRKEYRIKTKANMANARAKIIGLGAPDKAVEC